MLDLYIHGRKTNSIFEMLGTKENDISYAIGLGFSKVPGFLNNFLEHLDINVKVKSDVVKIKLQVYEREKGYTDFEIEQEGAFSLIIEAKKGWNYPEQQQLDQYSPRESFISSSAKIKKIVVFTESSQEFTKAHFQIKESNFCEVTVVSYRELWLLAKRSKSKSNNYEKHFLTELINYLGGLMTMKNLHSNLAYVVAISTGKEKDWEIRWTDIVEQGRYFHPVGGKGWPSHPPNYIAFRYHGKLQSIHHIEKYEVFTDPNVHFKEIPSGDWGAHFLYYLSEPMYPSKIIKTGNLYRNGRVWAMLDLLLVSKTIAEARDKTKEREKNK